MPSGTSSWRAGSSSPPSAPPLQAQSAGATAAGSSSSAAGSDGSALPHEQASPVTAAARDVVLFRDLLRRANNDEQLVGQWLAEMGYRPGQLQELSAAHAERERQCAAEHSGSIKAVGSSGQNVLGSTLAAWGSLASSRCSPTKEPLKAAGAATTTPSDLDTAAAEAGAPRHFFCPISLQIMRDPVMLATGQTYDRPCIERWLAQGNASCPATGQALAAPVSLVPNVALRASIEEWAEKHAPWLLDINRRVKPVPKEDAFGAMPSPTEVRDPDLAFAIRLQQEELQRIASARQAAAYGGVGAGPAIGSGAFGPPTFGGGVAAGAAPSTRAGGGGGGRGGSGAAGSEQPHRRWVSLPTVLLLLTTAAYVALFIVSLSQNGWNLADLSLNPWAGASQAALLAVGAQDAQLVTTGGQWWRLFSSPFVNAGVIQLLLNMACLWTFGRYLEGALAKLWAGPAMAAIYLVGAWLGAATSANLNTYYVTCGASAGVCALLGAVWADQLLCYHKYVHHAWTFLVLFIVTALYIVMSLLPLLDPWYQAAALLAGFLCGAALLLVPHVRRGRAGSRRALAAQCLCAALVIGGATAAALGIALDAGLGSEASFLKDGSCVAFGYWRCLPAGASPNGCLVQAQDNGSQVLYCPSGDSHQLPSGTTISSADTDLLTAICTRECPDSTAAAGGSPGPAGPPDDGWSSPATPSPPAASSAGPAAPGNGTRGGASGVLMSVGLRD